VVHEEKVVSDMEKVTGKMPGDKKAHDIEKKGSLGVLWRNIFEVSWMPSVNRRSSGGLHLESPLPDLSDKLQQINLKGDLTEEVPAHLIDRS
jgi:hypothetical protein